MKIEKAIEVVNRFVSSSAAEQEEILSSLNTRNELMEALQMGSTSMELLSQLYTGVFDIDALKDDEVSPISGTYELPYGCLCENTPQILMDMLEGECYNLPEIDKKDFPEYVKLLCQLAETGRCEEDYLVNAGFAHCVDIVRKENKHLNNNPSLINGGFVVAEHRLFFKYYALKYDKGESPERFIRDLESLVDKTFHEHVKVFFVENLDDFKAKGVVIQLPTEAKFMSIVDRLLNLG